MGNANGREVGGLADQFVRMLPLISNVYLWNLTEPFFHNGQKFLRQTGHRKMQGIHEIEDGGLRHE